MDNQTRRDFLLGSGAGVLGVAVSVSAETPTPRTTGSYQQTRKIPVDGPYDLVVAGGGPAGAAAAVCAARLGAKVLLIEATGCLGGMGTSGLVTAFDPMANGEQMVVGGLMREIVETLYERQFLPPGIDPDTWRKKFHSWTPFQVEGYKLVLDELAVDAGVHIRFFTTVVDADADAEQGYVRGVITHNIEGFRYIKAKTFIDASGDAVLADLCGAKCWEPGRDTPQIMPTTLCSLFAGINWPEFRGKSQHVALNEAIENGHFTQRDRHLPGMSRANRTIGYLNGGHMFNLNALRCKDLTEGIMLGRRLAQEYHSFYRKYMPGCGNLEHVVTASLIGVRESRRVLGEYELNLDDYIARRRFPDQIGIFCKFVDVHAYDTSDEEWKRFTEESGVQTSKQGELAYKPGEYYGIPYGILVPKGWKNLWVAGKIVSTDVKVHGSLRVQPACAMMGQAAGTAAIQSLQTGKSASDIDTEKLITTLREAGANLPQETLSKTMTKHTDASGQTP